MEAMLSNDGAIIKQPGGIMTVEKFLTTELRDETHFASLLNLYVSHNHPPIRGFYAHIPNETNTSDESVIFRMFAMGVLKGFPDFIFLFQKDHPVHPYALVYNPFFLELKMPKGKLTKSQKALHPKWIAAGVPLFVAYNQQQCVDLLTEKLGVPLYNGSSEGK